MSQRFVRTPAVAGLFYPADAASLAASITNMLSVAAEQAGQRPKVLVVPHAGYRYSGPIAASAYRCLQPWADQFQRVILLGPVHRVAVRGLALPGCDAFQTPLGEVPVDAEWVARVMRLPQVTISPAAHAHEHSLEVQLPFLQAVLPTFSLLPLAVGNASAAEVSEVLECVWGGPETLLLISTDLSHYLPYLAAKTLDRQTCDAILQCDLAIDHEQACGATPLRGMLMSARQHQLQARLLDLRNSGDTAGSKDKVVGYAAFRFSEPGQ